MSSNDTGQVNTLVTSSGSECILWLCELDVVGAQIKRSGRPNNCCTRQLAQLCTPSTQHATSDAQGNSERFLTIQARYSHAACDGTKMDTVSSEALPSGNTQQLRPGIRCR
jgi:hypothetical protein